MPRTPIQEHELIQLLKLNYELEIQSVQLLQLGADMNALTYKANAKSKSYFVKIKYDSKDDVDLVIMPLLHGSGLTELILPIVTVDGALVKQFQHFKMIVYPFIEGRNGFDQPLTKSQWIELGQALKKIHSLTIVPSIQKQLGKETFPTIWYESVRSFYPQIESNCSEHLITTEFKTFFKEKFNVISELVTSVEQLSKEIQPNLSNYVLCHSDLHAGNILMSSDESFYIIDWDAPLMAPKERDLMFIGGGVGTVWNLPKEIAYFYEGYGEVIIDKKMLAYYRYNRIVEDLALYTQDLLASDHNEQSKLISFKHFKSQFEPNGVIDIAFRTDY